MRDFSILRFFQSLTSLANQLLRRECDGDHADEASGGGREAAVRSKAGMGRPHWTCGEISRLYDFLTLFLEWRARLPDI